MCRLRMAVDRRFANKDTGERQADFINCTAWRQQAEFISRYFTKGKMILVEGSLRNNDYTDNNGVKHYSMDVLIETVSFCGDAKSTGNNANTAQLQEESKKGSFDNRPLPESLQIGDLGEFEEILSDGEVPF